MQRLVYSPKVYVFIKDSEGEVRNVSDFVVSGSVTRRINQVSSAEIELRNPNKIFTNPKVGVPFMPMDPITIYLERLYGHPVRVFTGYLDKTPYYQLYPGTIRLEASCTLKRLLYRFFDIALPYTLSFLAEHGWVNANGQGRLLTPNGEFADNTKRDGGVLIIGDSLTVGSESDLRKKLKGAVVISQGSEPTKWGVDQLEAQKGSLPGTVVMGFGTNDTPDEKAFRKQVERALKIVGPDRHLVWINVWRTHPTANTNELSGLNIVLEELAEEHPNMSIVDWAKMVSDEEVTLGDNAHTDPAGYKKRADAISQTVGGKSEKARAIKIKQMTAQEGFSSIGELLMDTLVEIGGWDPDRVLIENLPAALPDRLAGLYDSMVYESEAIKGEFSKMLKEMIGESSLGGSNYGSGNSSSRSGISLNNLDKEQNMVLDYIVSIGKDREVPRRWILAAIATGLVETGGPNPGDGGLRNPSKITDHDSQGWRQERLMYYKDPLNVPASVNRFYDECAAEDRGQGIGNLAQDVQGSDHPERYAQRLDEAIKLLEQWESKYGATGNKHKKGKKDNEADENAPVKRSERKGGNKASSSSGDLYSPVKGLSTEGWPGPGGSFGAPRSYQGGHAGVDVPSALGDIWYSITDGEVVAVSNSWYQGSGCVVVKSTQKIDNFPDGLRLGYGGTQSISVQVGDKVRAGDPIAVGGTHGSGPHLHFFIRKDDLATNGDTSLGDPTSLVKAAAKGQQPTKGPGKYGGDGKGGSSITGDVLGDGAAQAFAATLELPGVMEMAEAMALQGHKSLMNDKPLMPFIQQLVEASLRSFQSMPNGDFFAFYPDYFGELHHHPPYWEIDDIEILDGGVDLTDDNLVTHMYVVGDTAVPFGGDVLANKMFTTGVVDIFSAFGVGMVDVRTPDETMTKAEKKELAKTGQPGANNLLGVKNLLERDQAVQFLQRYGPRPVVEDMPLVKNHVYEMFLAYQKFMLGWSRQFVTPFTFTFMPELYPGGKVGFPRHSLQMYIEEVTHSFDYSSGFTTTATLSAPSVYVSGRGGSAAEQLAKLPPNMVEAIIDPIRRSAETSYGDS